MESLGDLGWITERYWHDSDERCRCRPGVRRFFEGMAACGARVVSGEGVLKPGVGDAEFVLPGGWAEAMAMRMRRTLRVTRAPILSSLSRIVPQVACVN